MLCVEPVLTLVVEWELHVLGVGAPASQAVASSSGFSAYNMQQGQQEQQQEHQKQQYAEEAKQQKV